MNVNLEWNSDLLAGIYFQDELQLNRFGIRCQFRTATVDAASMNVAMDRVKFFIEITLRDAVFMALVNDNSRERAEMLELLGLKVIGLPEEPVDQIIGMMLYYKINAMCEGRLILTRLDVNSMLGQEVWFAHESDSDPGPFAQDGWWHHPGSQACLKKVETIDTNVLKVEPNGWGELELNWPDDAQSQSNNNSVVYAKFTRDETDQAR